MPATPTAISLPNRRRSRQPEATGDSQDNGMWSSNHRLEDCGGGRAACCSSCLSSVTWWAICRSSWGPMCSMRMARNCECSRAPVGGACRDRARRDCATSWQPCVWRSKSNAARRLLTPKAHCKVSLPSRTIWSYPASCSSRSSSIT